MSPETLLDELQAAESAGAEALGYWLAACRDPALRGGLRVIRARNGAHARLARRRLAAIGGSPGQDVSRHLASLCGVLAAPEVSNRSKLAILLSRFPARTDDPVADLVPVLDDDETRALLETIGDDDRAGLRWLYEIGDTLAAAAMAEPRPASPRLLHVLDAYRAAETAAAEVVSAWRNACPMPGLRGGLETIAEREATHAALLDERLRELGGMASQRLDAVLLATTLARFGSTAVSDEEKLAFTLARYPTDEDALAPLQETAADLDDDPETREMLRLLASGEVATIAWLRSYGRAMIERPREVSLRVFDGGR